MSATGPVKRITPTCVICRERKLRCGGGNPCGPCLKARKCTKLCTYAPQTVGLPRTQLPKGGACFSCRQRKRLRARIMIRGFLPNLGQKCDGNIPCRNCKNTGHPGNCCYPDRTGAGQTKSVQASTSSEPANPSNLGSSGPLSAIELSTTEYLPDCHPADRTASVFLPNIPLLYDFDACPVLPGYPGVRISQFEDTSVPPCSSSLHNSPQCMDFPSHPTLADQTVEFLSDRAVTSRNFFLGHCWQYGVTFTAEKREALSRGDWSGEVVHPVLIHLCQLLGYHLATSEVVACGEATSGHFPADTQRLCDMTADGEAEQVKIIHHILQKGVDNLDTTTSMQVYTLLGGYYAMTGNLPVFTQLFETLGMLVLHIHDILGLDDALVLDLTSHVYPEFSCSQEARSWFSSMIFLELTVSLVLKAPSLLDESTMLAKFRTLTAIQPRNTALEFIRARSALFLYDAQRLIAKSSELDFDSASRMLWSKRYWDLIENIYAYLAVINTPLVEMFFIHAAQVFTLKTCIIIALAALADLHGLFAPFQPDSERQRGVVIAEISTITNICMSIGSDFRCLDTITTLGASTILTAQICWAIALKPLVSEVSSADWDDVAGHISRGEGGTSSRLLDVIRGCFQHVRLAPSWSHWA
ncbi:hypothetical protein C8R47DRAFT_1080531 [Mycena vitilis]|nr:hypothetical protein C8R47DRAFT_1080531 [Mycena vitilis]